ncbi:hypothetical protein [Corynebacterium sp. HMSC071B10]|uniref:hypothetical protein n=1 Tax=Corynebacterium sp. HMSC071B10 TaxID=1739494 RepID=UPI0008A160D1|nr:hypothetical protein [Corynebacterium sp. HMSC071B10]OFP34838.1 hypothetical protein HMPREF2990_09520 [Corynebacterium sp. HMSC071B10]
MRTSSALAAGTLIVALSAPFAWAQEPVEQLLIDVHELHDSYTDTLETQLEDIQAAEEAEDEEALVAAQDAYRKTLKEWRTELIDAADELGTLREDAKDNAPDGELTKQEKKAFAKTEDAIREDRATVRELREEVLGDDEAVYLPGVIGGLGGLLGTTASDAIERSEQGDKRIVFGLPGEEEAEEEAEETSEPTTTEVTTPEEPRPYYRAEVMQESSTTTSTSPTSSTSESTTTNTESTTTNTDTGTATTTPTSTTAPAETTTGTAEETTSATAILQNRTTSASSSSSTVTRTTSSTTSTTETSEETRDGDLAETGTPMRNLIVLAALLTLAGAFLVRRPA